MTPDRADNIYRHRFTAAHELGHVLMHHDIAAALRALTHGLCL